MTPLFTQLTTHPWWSKYVAPYRIGIALAVLFVVVAALTMADVPAGSFK